MAITEYVYRAFRSNRRRNMLGVSAVVVSVFLMVLVGVLFNVALVTFSDIFAQGTAYDLQVSPPSQDISNLTYMNVSDVEPALREVGANGVFPIITQIVLARESGSATAPTSFTVLYGAPAPYEEGKVLHINGTYDISGGSCVLSKDAASVLNLSVGDVVQAIGYRGALDFSANLTEMLGDPAQAGNLTSENWTVAGVIDQRGRFIPGVEEYLVKDLGTVRDMYGIPGKASTVLATVDRGLYDLNNPQDPAGAVFDLGKRVALRLGPAYVVTAPRAQAIESSLQASQVTNIIAYVFSIVFPTISGILIASILNLSVEQRAKDIAVMRLLGARRRLVGRVVVGELALMLAIGVPVGVGLGVGLPFAAHLAEASQLPSDFSQVVDWSVVAVQVLITLVITGLFALSPMRRAMATTPADAISLSRPEGEYRYVTKRGVDRRLLVGSFLLFVALVYATFFIPYFLIFAGDQFFTFFIFSFLTILLAYCVWMLALVPLLQRGIVALMGPFLPGTRKLLRSSLERYTRRNASTALIFSIIVAIMLFFSALFGAISGSIDRTTRYELGSDVRVMAGSPLPQKVVDSIRGSDYARAVAASTGGYRTGISDLVSSRSSGVEIAAVEGDLVAASFATPADVWRGDLSTLRAIPEGSCVISRGLALELQVGLGDDVVIAHEEDRIFLRVGLILNSLPGFLGGIPQRPEDARDSTVLLSVATFARAVGVPQQQVGFNAVFVSVRAGHDLDAVAKQIQQRYRVFYAVQVIVPATVVKFAKDGLAILNALFYVILTILLLVALFSLVANLLASILEREYEIGVVRALGLRVGRLRQVLIAEGTAIALSSLVLGVVVGTTLSALIIAFFNMLSPIRFTYIIPWASILYLLVLTVILSLVGTYSPARSVSSKPVVDLMRRAT
jgi:putative ABC transport system permease protein